MQAVVLAAIKTTAIERGFVGAQIGLADAWYLAGWTSKPDQLGGLGKKAASTAVIFQSRFLGSLYQKGLIRLARALDHSWCEACCSEL